MAHCYLCMDTGVVPMKGMKKGMEYTFYYSCRCAKAVVCPGMASIEDFPFWRTIEARNRRAYDESASNETETDRR